MKAELLKDLKNQDQILAELGHNDRRVIYTLLIGALESSMDNAVSLDAVMSQIRLFAREGRLYVNRLLKNKHR